MCKKKNKKPNIASGIKDKYLRLTKGGGKCTKLDSDTQNESKSFDILSKQVGFQRHCPIECVPFVLECASNKYYGAEGNFS